MSRIDIRQIKSFIEKNGLKDTVFGRVVSNEPDGMSIEEFSAKTLTWLKLFDIENKHDTGKAEIFI